MVNYHLDIYGPKPFENQTNISGFQLVTTSKSGHAGCPVFGWLLYWTICQMTDPHDLKIGQQWGSKIWMCPDFDLSKIGRIAMPIESRTFG